MADSLCTTSKPELEVDCNLGACTECVYSGCGECISDIDGACVSIQEWEKYKKALWLGKVWCDSTKKCIAWNATDYDTCGSIFEFDCNPIRIFFSFSSLLPSIDYVWHI